MFTPVRNYVSPSGARKLSGRNDWFLSEFGIYSNKRKCFFRLKASLIGAFLFRAGQTLLEHKVLLGFGTERCRPKVHYAT